MPTAGFLRPVPPFPAIALSVGSNVLGRGRGGVMDPRVSREHAVLSVAPSDEGYSYQLKCLGQLMCVSRGGVVSTLKREEELPLSVGDSIHLLPKLHKFHLEMAEGSAATTGSADATGQPPAKRQHVLGGEAGGDAGGTSDGDAGGTSDGSGGAGGGGGASSGGGGGDDEDIGSPADWLGMALPPWVQPAKPAAPEGLDALQRMATGAQHAPPERVLLMTSQLIVAYDVYPKARRHLLILPRERLDNPGALTAQHLPLVRRMVEKTVHPV